MNKFLKGFSVLGLQVVLQLLLIGLVSVVSQYPVPDFKDSNWDVVLFLTPLGILKNLLADSPVLRSFYLDISNGQSKVDLTQSIFMAAFFVLMLINAVSIWRKLSVRGQK